MNEQIAEPPARAFKYDKPTTPLSQPPSPVACAVPIVFAILLGFALRCSFVGAKPLWEDEGWTFNIGVSDQKIFDATGLDLHPLSFYFLWRCLPDFCYQSDWGFRLPSVIFSCISVIIWAGVLTIASVDRRIRAWSVLVFALLPMNIRYSQEARAYALTQMLALFAILSYLWAAKSPRPLRLIVLTLAVAASCHVDGYGIATPFVLGLHALWQAFRNKSARRLVFAIIGGAVLAVPYYYTRITYIVSHHSAHTIADSSNLWLGVVSRFVQLSPLGINVDQLPGAFQWAIYVLSLSIVCLLFFSRGTSETWIPRNIQRLFWMLFTIPFSVLLLGSIATKHNLIHIKYILICVPGILPLLIAGVMRAFRGRSLPAYAFLFLIPLVVSIGFIVTPGARADWHSLFQQIEPRLREGDGFIQMRERNYPLYSFGTMRAYMWRKGLSSYAPENYIEYLFVPMKPRTKIPLDQPTAWHSPDEPQAIIDFARSRPSKRVWTLTTGWMAGFREPDLSPIATPVDSFKANDIKATLWEVHSGTNGASSQPGTESRR